jgi:ABC-2 type transport system permease protein
MSVTAAIAGRELRAYFLTPGGYVVAALFTLLNGLLFVRLVFNQGEVAALRPIFGFSMVAFMLLCPAITMRVISEELRLGTIEVLMTAPVRSGQIIAGKFLAALGFLAVLLVPTLLFVVALEAYGRPDYGELACGYFGVVLAGSAYLASGVLASTLTSSQVVAYLVTVFFWLILLLLTSLVPQVELLPALWRDAWSDVLFALDPGARLRDFAMGLIDTADVVYFCSLTILLLVASVVSLDARRWR